MQIKIHVLKTVCSLLLLLVMIPGAFSQVAIPDESLEPFNKRDMNKLNVDPDKSATYRLNVVGSDALIYGLTVGRGRMSFATNTALGVSAMESYTGLWVNTQFGPLLIGGNNTATGFEALRNATGGMSNTAVGHRALLNNTSASNNTALGAFALVNTNSGYGNTALGFQALYSNTTGFSNIAIGGGALYNNIDRSNLVAVGEKALFNNGFNATSDHHGIENTALGSEALYENTTGYYNTATGFQALYNNTIGFRNTAFGHQALHLNTTGSYNTALGRISLDKNTDGSENTGIGHFSLNVLNSGSGNTAIGYSAGDYTTKINFGTFVGYEAYPFAGGYSNVTGIGYNARPSASNQVRISNTAVTSIGGYAGWTTYPSDGGYKNNIEEDVAGLDFILKLRPVSYNLDAHRLASDLGEDVTRAEDGSKATAVPDEITQKSRDEKAAIRYTGFIAQEVEAAVNDLGVAFGGVDAPVNKSGFYGLRYAEFVVPLVRAVQEQQVQIEALSPEGIDALREELSELRQANELLLAAEASLRAENETLSQRQSLLEAENESIRRQVTDILSMLETLGVDMQDCCQQQTTGRNPGTSSLNQMPDNSRLEQNTPNPFHENTLIRYFLPEETHRAQILVTDMAGLQVMAFPLEHQGAGQVLIHGGTLPSGTYVYTLTVDGRKVDSKRMVLL